MFLHHSKSDKKPTLYTQTSLRGTAFLPRWASKIAMPKPVSLIFPYDPLSELLNIYHRKKPSNLSLNYLGPRFDTTYSAWKILGV